MHVLLTNDDGPLNDLSCPYIKFLVDEINETTDWDLSIVVPSEQKSWIGKAHFAGKTLTASYIYTKYSTTIENPNINNFEGPFQTKQDFGSEYQEWCLIDGTPAACADLGVHYLYTQSKSKPIDLVISGPNFGKNSGSLYILSSGTVGAAMEAVTHGVKSIALSYCFNSLDHNFRVLKEAAKISVKLIQKLYKELQKLKEIDLFSVNVPLVSSLNLRTTKIHYTPILENYWNSIYEPLLESSEAGREQFLWKPDFKKVYKDALDDMTHSDNRVLLEEGISVTPLKAQFSLVGPLHGEIILNENDDQGLLEPMNLLTMNGDLNIALVTISVDSYIFEPLMQGLTKVGFQVSNDFNVLNKVADSNIKIFHYGEYEDIKFDLLEKYPQKYFVSSYVYRKALIRKHYLMNTIHQYIVKHPESSLIGAVPDSYRLEVDYAEFLDDALDDAYELREEVNLGEKTWILKPSMSEKGQGIRLFKSIGQLQQIFDSFEEDDGGTDEECASGDSFNDKATESNNGVIISQLRHFVVQEYLENPLLLSNYSNKKFHLRTYVICEGNILVFVYKGILSLFADVPFSRPTIDREEALSLNGHLTNTCLQSSEHPLVVPFWDMKDLKIGPKEKDIIFNQVCNIVKDLFDAAYTVDKINFQPLDNALEIFGIDLLVSDNYRVTLLEVNACPDFKQTGKNLKGLIFKLFDLVAKNVVTSLVTNSKPQTSDELVKVLEYESH
ncbi:uncharacterized protein PRCAT00001247001 [Priceomyces carsonii]|uniref:uncharacterized protein n=1 Tax=Priceomyces carsonii TaxID=28549 RepID=UPI002ED89BCA|nr:unnamed protein product [Priceomyces carsonii]